MIKRRLIAVGMTIAISAAATFAQLESPRISRQEVPYVPTSQAVVDAMLEMGKVTKTDTVYDLGSGDGRIPITAAKKFGAKGVGIDINAALVEEATNNAKAANVSDKVSFTTGDLFNFDFSSATVVTLYLLPEVNLRLRPILWKQLKPGTRVVSHAFSMGEWKPEETRKVDGSTIYFYRIPTKKEQDRITKGLAVDRE